MVNEHNVNLLPSLRIEYTSFQSCCSLQPLFPPVRLFISNLEVGTREDWLRRLLGVLDEPHNSAGGPSGRAGEGTEVPWQGRQITNAAGWVRESSSPNALRSCSRCHLQISEIGRFSSTIINLFGEVSLGNWTS